MTRCDAGAGGYSPNVKKVAHQKHHVCPEGDVRFLMM
jgi:hypothetical protein